MPIEQKKGKLIIIKRVRKNGKSGFYAPNVDKVFYYRPGDKTSRRRAKSKADRAELENVKKTKL